jgi:two-component system, NtrC family, response regulator AtoC
VTKNMTEAVHLLVVSRDSAALRPLWSTAESNFWHVETAVSAWEAIERVQSSTAPHLLLLDVPGGDRDSLHILRWMRRLRPDLPVVVICGAEDGSLRREATRLGARDVLIKPLDEARLAAAIHSHLVFPEDEGAEMASEDIEQLGPDSFFVSAGPTTQNLRAQAELLAEVDVPVLILGERGSGKDTVAKLIHKLSVRSGFEFLKLNCADMPGDLLGAELFGNERASPASSSRGKIERAEKGTIFLDEIAEMPLGIQARLVQMLQDKSLPSKGNAPAVSVDVRILAATSTSIERALAERRLREDLYYRLSAFTVQVPALRQRRSEIPVLLQHSMHQLARHYGLPPREFAPGALAACQNYSWPGNLNELESFVKRYLVAGDTEFTFKDQKANVTGSIKGEQVAAGSTPMSSHFDRKDAEQKYSGRGSLKSLIQNVKWEAERNAIGTALQKTGWNRKAAARLLQVSYRTLLYKIDQYHMNASEPFLSPLPAGKLSFLGATTRTDGKGDLP